MQPKSSIFQLRIKWISCCCVCWPFTFIEQVDLHGLLSMVPLPLSQGVVLSLLQQLACDINNDTPRKLAWMTDIAAAINPSDPMITLHVRGIFEQVYQILNHQRSLPTMTGPDLSSIRLLMHVVNSVLVTCKWFFNVQIHLLNFYYDWNFVQSALLTHSIKCSSSPIA